MPAVLRKILPEGSIFIQAAQYEAVDNDLTDAGFGIQLCNVCNTWGGGEAYL